MRAFARIVSLLIWAAALAVVSQAQNWDTSGNSLLKGSYNFRQVALRVIDSAGDVGQALSLYGSVNFDGNGGYSMTGTAVDSSSPQPQSFTANGTYSIAASGYGFMSSQVSDGDFVYGLVSNGVFVGSSTESGFFNDLFVAVAAGSPPVTNSTFQGSYTAAYMNLASPTPQLQYDSLVRLSPDGQGNLGPVTLNTYQGSAQTPANLTQSNVTYAFSNGVGTASFPASVNQGISGQQLWYVSSDGNLFVGGSGTGWDMILGVRTSGTGSAQALSGLYYQAGLNRDESQLLTPGSVSLDTFYGSLAPLPGGKIVAHKRLVTFDGVAKDYTFSDTYPNAGGEYLNSATSTQYAISRDGRLRIGLGIGPFLGVSVAVQAPNLTGTGVFLNPVGLQNSASSALFTARIARGELILLNGTNLANRFVITSVAPFTNSLDGVQVFINNVAAPIYYVGPGFIAAIVPYETTAGIAEIRVVNNGVSSKVITAYVGKTAPGVLTNPPGGISRAIVQHLDYSLVTAANPARVGETVLGYLTGTGDVTPAIANGGAGPSDPLSKTVDDIKVKVDQKPAAVVFSGLVPTLSGLYAIVFTVPAGTHSGDVPFEISGSDSVSSEALLPVASN